MTDPIGKRVAQEARTMTRNEVILKAIEGRLTWLQASDVLGVSPRQMRRLRARYEAHGYDGLVDRRGGKPRRKRIAVDVIAKVCALKREVYPDFNVQHFWEQATEKHGVKISYTWCKVVLQEAGLAERAPGRGKHRRRRERAPMRGMLLHCDGSTHCWLSGRPACDLIIVLDDADGRLLYAKFVPEEGTLSTLEALRHVLEREGRFAKFYHDCGSHFGRTSQAGKGPDSEQNGQVTRALRALGIRQIFARSPQARGRCERAFGTIQGRLPQELRLAGVEDYDQANRYLQAKFLPSFNRRFTVKPAQPESVFVPLAGIDLELLLSVQHERVVQNDNTVRFQGRVLQLPKSKHRMHFVRCPVTVHQFVDGSLGISYQGGLLARYDETGSLAPTTRRRSSRAA